MSDGQLLRLDAFGGLDLREGVEAQKLTALIAKNVDLDGNGERMLARPGLVRQGAQAALVNPYSFAQPFYNPAGDVLIVAGTSLNGAKAVSSAGAVIHTATGFSGESSVSRSGAAIGTPNNAAFYFSHAYTAKKYTRAGGFVVPTITYRNVAVSPFVDTAGQLFPVCRSYATWAGENRLVCGGLTATANTSHGPGGAANSLSHDHVWFSEPGNPEMFRSDSFLRLSPGDGEEIVAIVPWGEMVFVFKQTKFFVITHVSTDGFGIPYFNYRMVDVRIGAQHGWAVTAGRDGVYFLGADGIYRTTGGPPQLISGALAPLFRQMTPIYGSFPALSSFGVLRFIGERLFLEVSGGAYVYDFYLDAWFHWDWASALNGGAYYALTGMIVDDVEEVYVVSTTLFSLASGGARGVDIRHDGVSVNVAAEWLGRFMDFGEAKVKRLSGTRLHGSGTITFDWFEDWKETAAGSDTVAFGSTVTDPPNTKAALRAYRGGVLAPHMAASGSFSLHRLEPRLFGLRALQAAEGSD